MKGEEEELEIDEESGLRQMEMHTLNQLNSLLKPDRRAPKRPMPCGIRHASTVHVVDSNGPSTSTAHIDGIDFNMTLIREVRDRPFLYDVLAEAYNNPSWRIAAWNDVSILLVCTPDQVKTRWKTLRDRFKKEDKKVVAGETSTWSYFDALEFLRPHLRDKYIVDKTPIHHQPHTGVEQHDRMFREGVEETGDRSHDENSTDKWRMEESIMKDVEDHERSGSPESKRVIRRMDEEENGAEVAVSVCLVDEQTGREDIREEGGTELSERRGERTIGEGGPLPSIPSYHHHRDIIMSSRMSGGRHLQQHYTAATLHLQHAAVAQEQKSQHSIRWNVQDEDEVFGHMIALRLAKMDPRFKESVKVKLMQTLYDAQFGPDSPQSVNNLH